MKQLEETNGQPTSVRQYIMPCVVASVASLFFPPTLYRAGGTLQRMTQVLGKLAVPLFMGQQFETTPALLRRVLQRLPFTRTGKVCALMNKYTDFIRKQIEDYKSTWDEEPVKDFIKYYTERIERAELEGDQRFQYRFLVGSVKDLIMGGTFSSTSAIHWHLLNFAARPDTVQARVQLEIDEVVGTERAPTWEDRKRMPYTLACIWELDRWKTPSPLGAARVTSDDLVAEGVFIPKDTVIVFNTWAVHNDTSYWKDPYCFNPCRFLNKDGSTVSQKPPHWMPFSVGRRSCPGEAFATLEIFLLLTLLLQKFRVVLETPLPYDLDDPRIEATSEDLSALVSRAEVLLKEIVIREEMVQHVEATTREQSKCAKWFAYRADRPSVLTPLKKATPADEAKPSDGGKDPWDDTAEPNSSVEIEDKDAKETCTLAEATTGETQDTYDTVMPASCSAPAKRLHEETDEQEEKDQEKGCSDEPPPKAPPGRRPAFKPKPGVQAKRRTTTSTPPR
ncbi:hypothetical protein HPB49_007705 [Dermacentor silvarum]|uniref:Uncharacterized protein n=1 Tax=Dermacentor silvarum TaxID=543639 RepID=A0ACB8CDQ4_DERSI|nr:hypothetical protein HPB49_007705 [Dermacentor silvarum]